MELKSFKLLSAGEQFALLIDPSFEDGNIEIHFTKSDLSAEQLVQVLKVNAKTRVGGDNSFRRMVYFILSQIHNEKIDIKQLVEYIIVSQPEYSTNRKRCLEVFLK